MTRLLAWALLPGLLLGLVIASLLIAPAWLAVYGRSSSLGAPPVQQLAFERVQFVDAGISALVRAGPAAAVRIAQAQVDALPALDEERDRPMMALVAAQR